MKAASGPHRTTPLLGTAILVVLISGSATSQVNTPRDFWRSVVKGPLSGPTAEEKWLASYKDAMFPGPGALYLEGTVVSVTSAGGRQQIVLSMDGDEAGDATLVFDGKDWKLRAEPSNGTVVRFWGVAREFTPEPFMVTFEPDRVNGLDLERGVLLRLRPTR